VYEPGYYQKHYGKASLSDLQPTLCSVEGSTLDLRSQGSIRGVGVMIFVVCSTGHFDPLIRKCDSLSSQFEFRAQIGSGTFVPSFPHFRTAAPKEIEECMVEAELVITHGGTGMLSMLYRLKKKSVVIPKQIRYGESNDSQIELARKWGEEGISLLCLDVDNLKDAILKCRSTEWKFPVHPKLGETLSKELRQNSGLEPVLVGT